IDETYSAISEKGLEGLDKPFSIHGGTQSRGSLWFRVNSNDNKSPPELIFRPAQENAKVCCDQTLSNNFEKAKSTSLDIDEALKVSQFLIGSERIDDAEVILKPYLDRYPNYPGLLLQLASIAKSHQDNEKATECLSKISPQSGSLGREEALKLARQAFDVEQYDLCSKVLEPFASQGSLSNQDLLFLARSWYFNKQFERAKKLLVDLDSRGFEDKSLFFTLGNIADKLDDQDSAIHWWEKTLRKDPNYFEALFNIGVAYYKQGDKDRAEDCWRRVLDLQPDSQTREATEEALKSISP
ncbi:tetratricopeptide repeat protein, partial [bacterium]|nr:tetratricopeptide repeat protein [bacterium]